jgi:RNA polymerase sigma-70 factor (ECF subfamily)
LYAFIRHRGYSPEDAQDLVQGFFLHLIEDKTLSRVNRSKGKFRSFLLASLKNYLANETDRARCLKRGGKAAFVHIDVSDSADVDSETHALCQALIAAEGWVIP